MSNDDVLHVRIGGMSCGGCVRGLSRAFEKAGLRATNLEVGRADLAKDTSLEAIRAAVEGAGFQLLGVENG
jgi:copper chaperone CopZ